MDLKDKTVLITGASSGIGYELSKIFSKEGSKIICLDMNIPEHRVSSVEYIKTDITNGKDVKMHLEKLGKKIDILINNAGVMRRGDIFNTSEEDYDLLFDVNVKGSWHVTKYTKEHLADDAMIVFMSSRHGTSPKIDPAIYSLTKHTVLAMAAIVEKTAPQYTVKVMCPGSTDTPLSRHGVHESALVEKKKTMIAAHELAEKIFNVIVSDEKMLLFNEEDNSYFTR